MCMALISDAEAAPLMEVILRRQEVSQYQSEVIIPLLLFVACFGLVMVSIISYVIAFNNA